MVRTRMPGGVGGKAREGLPIPIEATPDSRRTGAHWFHSKTADLPL